MFVDISMLNIMTYVLYLDTVFFDMLLFVAELLYACISLLNVANECIYTARYILNPVCRNSPISNYLYVTVCR